MSGLLRNTFAALILASSPILATIPVPGIAWAQEEAGDPPADVARVASISGAVSTHQPGSQDWDQAQQNYPLAPGSGVWVEPRSHAAVDVAGARVHLDGSSALEITAINQGQVQLQLSQGAALVHVYPGSQGVSFQVATPHGAANISQPGQYEIVAGDDQHPSSLSVLEGQAQFVGQNANLGLQAGQRGSIDPNNGSGTDAAQPDDFVRLVQQEEQPYQQQVAQTAQYVSPQQTGYQDLARYGDWQQAPQYGAVWYPQQVPANWAPYRYGHWAYVQPWGYTWVDDQPWGFTPFHYGRWVQVGHRWAWVPGERVARPVYAPALVSFFDLGGGASINLSLGWVPLAPEEVYVPYYRHSPRYVREVNITNVRNETTIINVVNKKTVINYNNYRNYRDATSVRRDVVSSGRPVGAAWSKHDNAKAQQQWSHAKPEQELAIRPQGNDKRGNGPKFDSQNRHQTQQQNWQPKNAPEAKASNQPEIQQPQGHDNTNRKANQPNAPWKENGPKLNNGKPKSQPVILPTNDAAQKQDLPSTQQKKNQKPAAVTNVPTAPNPSQNANAPQWKSNGAAQNKKHNQQPPTVIPTAQPKPQGQPQMQQEQTSKQHKVQQEQAAPRQNQQQWKQQAKPQQNQQQWKQQAKPQPQQNQQNRNQHQNKAPKNNQPPAQQQNCGQGQGACQN